MSAVRVMIIDDSTQRAQAWAADLGKLGLPNLAIEVPNNVAVAEALKALNIRRLKARKNEKWRDQPCVIDDVDVLLLDFDLIDFAGDSGEFATGEEIAYLARVFSTANVICVVNQFGINRFDLTFKVDLASRNDLDLGSQQIANPGLWKDSDSWRGFRPWHWPVLTSEVALYGRRLTEVKKNLRSPLLQYFGFDPNGEDPSRTLSKEAVSFFQGETKQMTFATAAESSTFVHAKDIPWLRSDDEQLARVSTAIAQKWLRKYVLVRQDILIDVPHLVSRKPWLLTDPKSPAMWQATTGSGGNNALVKDLQKFQFEHEHWAGRPIYWGERINVEGSLALPEEKWSYENVPELVFREDTSTFGKPANSLEFDCALGTSYDMRFVSNPEKEEKFDGVIDLRKVEYVPAIRLMM